MAGMSPEMQEPVHVHKAVECPMCLRQAKMEEMPEGYSQARWQGGTYPDWTMVRCPLCKAVFAGWAIYPDKFKKPKDT